MRHCAFGIEFCCLPKGTDSGAMIESVNESQALIEITLRFRLTGCDFARIGAEAIVKRFFRCVEVEAGHCQRRPDNDLEDFGGYFHRCSRQTIRRIARGKPPV
jgi:hypothetical protein